MGWPSQEGPGRSGLRAPLELSCSSALGAILEFFWAVSLSRTVADPSLASPQSVVLDQSASIVLSGLIGAKEADSCHWDSLCVQTGSIGPSWSGSAASLPLWPLGRLVGRTHLVQSQVRLRLFPEVPDTDWRPLFPKGHLWSMVA